MEMQAVLTVQKENIQFKHGLVCVRSSRQKTFRNPKWAIWDENFDILMGWKLKDWSSC